MQRPAGLLASLLVAFALAGCSGVADVFHSDSEPAPPPVVAGLEVHLSNMAQPGAGLVADEPLQAYYSLLDEGNRTVETGNVPLEAGASQSLPFAVAALSEFTFEVRVVSANGQTLSSSTTFTQAACGSLPQVELGLRFEPRRAEDAWSWTSALDSNCADVPA